MYNGYALTNPICILTDKPRQDLTRSDLIKLIKEKNLEKITFHYTALDGKLKELKIPIQSRSQIERILVDGERVDGSSLFKGMVETTLSDLYVVPVYRTAFINPFDNTSLDFICRYLTKDGDLAPFAPDSILIKCQDDFRNKTKMELHAFGELEFFLLSNPTFSVYIPERQQGYHSSAPFMKSGPVLNEMLRLIAQITGAVKYAHSEVGYIENIKSDIEEINGKQAEQSEIEFNSTPVDETADNLVIARWLIRNVAYKHGHVATFTPKLQEGIAGNGMHIHFELLKNGKNIMRSSSGELSEFARKAIGGLCFFADSLTAFGNTVASSYLRLVPDQEAPTKICWSDLNRNAMIRVPLGWTKTNNLAQLLNPQDEFPPQEYSSRQTVELRTPDGSALIHLLLAGITLAIKWGLTNNKSLEIAEKFYVSANQVINNKSFESMSSLPKSCLESANLLLKHRDYYLQDNLFPQCIIDYIVKILQAENDEHLHLTLSQLSADKRLIEVQKLLHKDLHKH